MKKYPMMATITNRLGDKLCLNGSREAELMSALRAALKVAKKAEKRAFDALDDIHNEANFQSWALAADSADEIHEIIDFINGNRG